MPISNFSPFTQKLSGTTRQKCPARIVCQPEVARSPEPELQEKNDVLCFIWCWNGEQISLSLWSIYWPFIFLNVFCKIVIVFLWSACSAECVLNIKIHMINAIKKRPTGKDGLWLQAKSKQVNRKLNVFLFLILNLFPHLAEILLDAQAPTRAP